MLIFTVFLPHILTLGVKLNLNCRPESKEYSFRIARNLTWTLKCRLALVDAGIPASLRRVVQVWPGLHNKG